LTDLCALRELLRGFFDRSRRFGPGEYWAVSDTLNASGHMDSKTRYPFITLHEPPKGEVLRWKPGQPFRREALVVVKQEAKRPLRPSL
jgi:hypothetical protein